MDGTNTFVSNKWTVWINNNEGTGQFIFEFANPLSVGQSQSSCTIGESCPRLDCSPPFTGIAWQYEVLVSMDNFRQVIIPLSIRVYAPLTSQINVRCSISMTYGLQVILLDLTLHFSRVILRKIIGLTNRLPILFFRSLSMALALQLVF